MKTHSYPAWFYGPNGQSQIFQSDAEVPAGWQDHPSKVAAAEKPKPAPSAPKPPAAPKADTATLDAHGHAWDASLHAATKSLTSAGLWRMKVGISRPDPAPGFPKPVLDL